MNDPAIRAALKYPCPPPTGAPSKVYAHVSIPADVVMEASRVKFQPKYPNYDAAYKGFYFNDICVESVDKYCTDFN